MSSIKPTPKKAENLKKTSSNSSPPILQALSVSGYKSISEPQRVELRPLTLLAGVNSGGKSSLIQPLLLLKQTLDVPYDPGSLLLDGANVRLTSADQLLTRYSTTESVKNFTVGFDFGSFEVELRFDKTKGRGLEVQSNIIRRPDESDIILDMNLDYERGLDAFARLFSLPEPMILILRLMPQQKVRMRRDRFIFVMGGQSDSTNVQLLACPQIGILTSLLRHTIHLPGLRGNPERTYKTTAVGDTFPGTFENYVASIIHHWNSNNDQRLGQLGKNLETLGLTWKVTAKAVDDTQVELKVGRLPHSQKGGAQDLVSIADVGFGVSQTLPLLVALLTANPGQVVYLEQPEIHLHPRAQIALAKILVEAAQRGVIVIAETHSALLLQGVQTLVAKDELSPDLVKLHWVERDEKGMTKVNSADLDSTGAFGDWPVDFMDVGLAADNEYLSAAEAKLFGKA